MFQSTLVAIKPDTDPEPLIALASAVTAPGGVVHLVSAVVVGSNDDERQRAEEAEGKLETLAMALREQGQRVETRVEVATMRAGPEVLRLARERGVEMVVIGHVKRTRVGKLLLGSDAQTIIIGSDCPVLSTHLR